MWVVFAFFTLIGTRLKGPVVTEVCGFVSSTGFREWSSAFSDNMNLDPEE